jgi:S1-C subfamily serine protease
MQYNLKARALPVLLATLFAGASVTGLATGATAAAVMRGLAARPQSAQVVTTAAAAAAAATVVPVANAPADLAATNAPAASVADSLQAAVESVYAQANPSVVYIVVSAGGYGYGSSQASGSGFVYNAKGMIVTNAHVVQGAQSIEVVFADGSKQSASLVGADAANDLAVIQVAKLPASAAPLTLAADNSVQVGEFVAAIGSPFGEQNSMSFGIVSGLNRTMSSSSSSGRNGRTSLGAGLTNLIQTDAPINPGNSGGPLLSLDGQVVGVNNAIESTSGSGSGVGFAIPASVIRQVVPGIIANAG